MALTSYERRVLQELEAQFDAQTSHGTDRWRRLHLVLGHWGDRLGWLAAIAGFVLVAALLQHSVLASFAAVLLTIVGVALLVTGRTGLAVSDALQEWWARRPTDTTGS